MGKVNVELTHYSNKPGCKGVPGEVVGVDEDLAKEWIAARGAKETTRKPTAKPLGKQAGSDDDKK